ncbi:MAG: diguanylate cyclase [Acidobacteriota bacterium]|jgi:diguanylate cyclase (GGDEF)-like protein
MKRQETRLNSAVTDRIIALLEGGPVEAAEWAKRMDRLEAEWGTDVYAVLLFVLTHLDFSGARAREHWGRVLRQWEQLNRDLPERVDLRVAVLHYFLRIQKKLRNPAIVELRILRRTQASVVMDELTRLHNFRFFQEQIQTEVRRTNREDTTLALLMVDIDDFKGFNDTRGHLAGNVALRRLAGVLKRAVRETDAPARYGGEEFAVLLPNTRKMGALKVAEKVRLAIEKAKVGLEKGRSGSPLTVSVGLATLPGDAANAEDLIEKADRALYIAKSMGKNCVKPFSDERREHIRLDTALTGQFSLVDSHRHVLTTLNVSEGGLLFLSEEPPNRGSLAQVKLALPPGGHPVEGVLRVMRVKPVKDGYEIGTQIVHMSHRDRHRFRIFLRQIKEGGVIQLLPTARAPRSTASGRRVAAPRAAKKTRAGKARARAVRSA